MLLGLDVSTSITGYTVVDDDSNIILNGAWDFRNKRKFTDIFAKAMRVHHGLDELQLSVGKQTSGHHTIDKIYIEKSLQSFRSGFSSAKTLSTLSSFNGIVSWLCYEVYGITPEYIAATSARKKCGLKIPKGVKAKDVVIKHLVDNEPNFAIEYTRNGNPKPYCYDMADSIIVARAGLVCEQESRS